MSKTVRRLAAASALLVCGVAGCPEGGGPLEDAGPSLEPHAGACFYRVERLDGYEPPLSTYRTEYDAEARLVRSEWDRDDDGNVDSTYAVEYDDDAGTQRTTWDDDNDGTPDTVYTFTFDEAGRYLRIERDDDADGTVDRIVTFEWTGDVAHVEWDDNADGTREYCGEEVQEAGRVVRRMGDANCDGAPETGEIYSFDEAGDLEAIERDTDGDGVADEGGVRWTRERDENGWVIAEDYDDGDDGVIERRTRFERDERGDVIGSRTDYLADGDDDELTRDYDYSCW